MSSGVSRLTLFDGIWYGKTRREKISEKEIDAKEFAEVKVAYDEVIKNFSEKFPDVKNMDMKEVLQKLQYITNYIYS